MSLLGAPAGGRRGSGPDAVVVGAGHNGLVAANILADAGWEVLVCEATPHVGGAVRSAEVVAPGYVSDLFSAFYPLAAVSPVLAALDPAPVRARVVARPYGVVAPVPRRPLRHVVP